MDEKKDNLTVEQVEENEQSATVDVAEVSPTPNTVSETAVAHDDDLQSVDNREKKSQIWGTIFFLVSIALSIVLMVIFASSYETGDNKDKHLGELFVEVFSNANVKYLLISIATLCAMIILDSLKYFTIMRATRVGAKYKTALTVGLLGKYYDYITPFASGGQPMQIYYLHKKGISGGESSAVIFIKFAFNMAMWLTICLCLMIFNRGALLQYVTEDTSRKLIQIGAWIGFAVNCAIPLFIIACVILPKMTWAIARWVLNIGHKLKLVKDKDAHLERTKQAVKDFAAAFKSMLKRPWHSIALALLCFAEQLLMMVLPYFVVIALGGAAVTPSWELMFAIMTLNVYVQMSVTVVPTPGNSGAMESAFMMALVGISAGVLFWTVFSWRFLSYYSYIIIGLVITTVRFIKSAIRRKKMLKQ